MKNKSMLPAYIALALVSFFWGTTYLATRIGVEFAHGFLLSAVRQLTAGGCLLAFMLLRGYRLPDRKTMIQLSILGFLFLGAGNGIMTWALQYVPSGLCSVLSALSPIFVVIVSHFIIEKTRWSFRLIFGMLLGTVGVVGIFYDYLEDLLNPNFSFGIGLTLGACAIWSFASVYAAKWKPKVHLLLGASIQMIVGGLASALVVGIAGWDNMKFGDWGIEFWGSIAYLVVFGSFVAYSAFLYVLSNLPPAQASLYAYINPVVAVLLGWLLLNENLNLITVTAMGTTVAGVYLVNTAFIRNKKKQEKETVPEKEGLELVETE